MKSLPKIAVPYPPIGIACFVLACSIDDRAPLETSAGGFAGMPELAGANTDAAAGDPVATEGLNANAMPTAASGSMGGGSSATGTGESPSAMGMAGSGAMASGSGALGSGALGSACSSASECASTFCVEGVCCTQACTAPCVDCPGTGVCSAAAAATACVLPGGEAGECDGNGGCASPVLDGFDLAVEFAGDGFGSVSIQVAGSDTRVCTGDCVIRVPAGTIALATATPRAYSVARGWSDPSCSADGGCPVEMTAHRNITVQFELGYDVAFVTSELYAPGAMPTAGSANEECARLARVAGLHNTRWVAWLSAEGPSTSADDDVHAIDFFQHTGGWVRTDGVIVAESLAALTAGEILNPINRTETGARAAGITGTWTATTPQGLALRSSFPDQDVEDCDGWSATAGAGAMGGIDSVGIAWSIEVHVLCDNVRRLYCFADDSDQAVPIFPAEGRTAFLSSQAFVPGDGLRGADDLCQRDACEAGLTGGTDCALSPGSERSFNAYLHTSERPAWERFDLDGPTWVRPDGIAWLAAASDLAVPTASLTGLNVSLQGEYFPGATGAREVWTGSVNGVQTCEDWTDPTSTGSTSDVDASTFWLTGRLVEPCSNAYRIYCLEN